MAGGGQPYTTISQAIAGMPSSLPPGKSCVVIEDSGLYAEQVTVQNFTMNFSSIAIFADVSFTPRVSPPGGTAAFVIANASVSVMGINIITPNPIAYGIFISSAYVQISSVNVLDGIGKIGTARHQVLSSWTTIS